MLPQAIIAMLEMRYAEPQRAYHVLAHIEALLRHFEAHQDLAADKAAILWAIWFHDAVYDPRAHDNEAQSADLFSSHAVGLDQETIARVRAFILATQRHEIPSGLDAADASDCGVFLDFDLSILGAPPAVFDAYERAVRKEYAFVEDAMFRAGRRSILERFLARDTLYFTPRLCALWEAPARDNLRRSIVALGAT